MNEFRQGTQIQPHWRVVEIVNNYKSNEECYVVYNTGMGLINVRYKDIIPSRRY